MKMEQSANKAFVKLQHIWVRNTKAYLNNQNSGASQLEL